LVQQADSIGQALSASATASIESARFPIAIRSAAGLLFKADVADHACPALGATTVRPALLPVTIRSTTGIFKAERTFRATAVATLREETLALPFAGTLGVQAAISADTATAIVTANFFFAIGTADLVADTVRAEPGIGAVTALTFATTSAASVVPTLFAVAGRETPAIQVCNNFLGINFHHVAGSYFCCFSHFGACLVPANTKIRINSSLVAAGTYVTPAETYWKITGPLLLPRSTARN
jgi:hypothetical protein